MKFSQLLFSLLILVSACTTTKTLAPPKVPVYNIIPYPTALATQKGFFSVSKEAVILLPEGNLAFKENADYLNNILKEKLGYSLKLDFYQKGKIVDGIYFFYKESIEHSEGYQMDISSGGVNIFFADAKGQFYAIQTLLQLFQGETSFLPYVKINDAPRYAYRGMHLDVARHHFPVSFIKKYIDHLAKYKYNNFHWHLTEDQGWRIEIKKYPKLQEVAAFRKETLIGHYSDKPHQFDGQKYGGYYTQDEISEVVAYAKKRHINIIPEIEMPGHAQAAIAAYPELGCTGKPIAVATKWGVFEDVYCPKEETFLFLEDVLTEVMELFPSKYIHIGGDECPKTQWKESDFCQDFMKEKNIKDEHELQSYFIQRMEKFINSKDRQIIGWDEILEGGLAPNATVMSWRGMKGGIEAARQGHDVIMTPGSHCYFDHYQSTSADEPLAIGGFTSLEKVYSFEPTPAQLSQKEAQHIIGAQANVWTEYMKTPEKVEYMIFPRMMALAEVVWSPKENRNFQSFVGRLEPHLAQFENAANHLFDVKAQIYSDNGVHVQLRTDSKSPVIRYSFGGSVTAASLIAKSKIAIHKSGTLKAASFVKGQKVGKEVALKFNIHKAAGKSIKLSNSPSTKYNSGGNTAIFNGVMGSDKRYGDKEWLGFEGEDCIAVIDFGQPTECQSTKFRFFNGKGQWIYPPKSVEIFSSDDGVNFTKVKNFKVLDGSQLIVSSTFNFEPITTRYLKVHVHRHGIIESGKQGSGHEAWLFVDEIMVE